MTLFSLVRSVLKFPRESLISCLFSSLNLVCFKASAAVVVILMFLFPAILLVGHYFFSTGDLISVFTNFNNVTGVFIKSIGYLSYWTLIVFYFFKGVKEYRRYWNKRLKPKARTRFYSFYLITNIHLLSTIIPGFILYLSFLTDYKIIESLNTSIIAPYYRYVAMPQYMILFGFLIFYGITESKWLKRVYLSNNIYLEKSLGNNEELDSIFNIAFEQQKIYRNPELTIDELSIKIRIKKAIIRKYILSKGYQSFTDFINQYRVSDFISRISSNQDSKLTLDSIAEESGFKSRATFYRVFKKNMGMSPTKYKKQVLANS